MGTILKGKIMNLENTVRSSLTNIAENVIKALASDIGVEGVLIGLHNAFTHGKIFEIADEEITDDKLERCFDHIEALLAEVKA